jgi:two-component system KDP operon response regulator KdpE
VRILLVDDDPEIRMITTFLLEQAGHQVREAEDAASARAAFNPPLPDVVLMDVMLGDVDGVELATELFGDVQPGAPKLVFLTGAVRPDQHARMNATAAAGVIRKPFDPATFVDSLHTILSE